MTKIKKIIQNYKHLILISVLIIGVSAYLISIKEIRADENPASQTSADKSNTSDPDADDKPSHYIQVASAGERFAEIRESIKEFKGDNFTGGHFKNFNRHILIHKENGGKYYQPNQNDIRNGWYNSYPAFQHWLQQKDAEYDEILEDLHKIIGDYDLAFGNISTNNQKLENRIIQHLDSRYIAEVSDLVAELGEILKDLNYLSAIKE
ncbi:MAG: hypothetical protein OXF77_05345 [Thaumarchaeota archaeon]|nr:hypothetical protein [Nitrososphaerota archaeon]